MISEHLACFFELASRWEGNAPGIGQGRCSVNNLALRAIIVTIGAVVGAIITIIVLEHWRLLMQNDISAQSIAHSNCGTTTARLR
jgi:hypothetical protein